VGLSYDLGLIQLREIIGKFRMEAQDRFAVLEMRWLENHESERLYGSTEVTRRDRAQIFEELNRLSLDVTGEGLISLSRKRGNNE
jgi:hypothetical protein